MKLRFTAVRSRFLPHAAGVNIRALPTIAALASTLVVALCSTLLWRYTWDDSAITLAFSRNLVRYGDIVASQYGDRVEGSSSFLWMVIHAGWFALGLSQDNVLALAKLTSLLLTITNIWLVAILARDLLAHSLTRAVAIASFALGSTSILAAVDGMETPLYATLVLAMLVLYRCGVVRGAGLLVFTLCGVLLVLVRHEGFLFLLPFALAELIAIRWAVFRKPYWYVWAATALCYHGWHYWYFGDFLTNPMHAKQFWPYRPPMENLLDHVGYRLYPLLQVSLFYFPLISFIILGRRVGGPKAQGSAFCLPVVFVAATSVAVAVLVGNNWGAANRLSYPGIACVILLALKLVDDSFGQHAAHRQRMTGVCFVVLSLLAVGLTFAERAQNSVRVDVVQKQGELVSRVQRLLGQERMTFMGPDMGGLLLFHGDGKRVLDLGLLCDPVLAKQGYSALDAYLRAERPEMIETHLPWTLAVANAPVVLQHYTPARLISQPRSVFLLRSDLIASLSKRLPVQRVPTQDRVWTEGLASASELDQTFIAQFPHALIIDDSSLSSSTAAAP